MGDILTDLVNKRLDLPGLNEEEEKKLIKAVLTAAVSSIDLAIDKI